MPGSPPVGYASYDCVLEATTFFDDCATLVADADTSFDEQVIKDCAYASGSLDQWFVSCTPAAARCE